MRRVLASAFRDRVFVLASALFIAGCVPATAQVWPPSRFFAGHEPLVSRVVDLNGDGKMDLVTTRSFGRGEISIWLGNGDGTFSPPTRIPGVGTPRGPAIADFNGDGKIDLAVADFVSPGELSVFLGRGDGTFAEPVQHLIGAAVSSLVASDVNGDGKMDIVSTGVRPQTSESSEWIFGKFLVMLGRGDGTFEAPHMGEIDGTPIVSQVGDWDGDGKIDAVIVLADQNRNMVRFLHGNGDGQFSEQYRFRLPFQPTGVSAPADLNGDGHPDLVISVLSGVVVYLGTGSGFNLAGSYYTEPTRSAWIADLDKDGKLDIITARRFLRGDGTGHFTQQAMPHPVADDSFVATGDFNGDGWVDVAATDAYHNQILVYMNRGGNVAAR